MQDLRELCMPVQSREQCLMDHTQDAERHDILLEKFRPRCQKLFKSVLSRFMLIEQDISIEETLNPAAGKSD